MLSVAELKEEDLRRALAEPLPGLSAQLTMAPRPRVTQPRPGHSPRRGGVLVLLYRRGGQWWFPLTLRTDTVMDHRGQVSLPGGAWEPDDAHLKQTALRETEEELGVPQSRLNVLGRLTPLYIPPSDFCIHPFVAVASARPAFRPDPREVAAVLEAPLSLLLDGAARGEEERLLHDVPVRVPFYRIGSHQVWGATAMVLAELAACLSRVCEGGP